MERKACFGTTGAPKAHGAGFESPAFRHSTLLHGPRTMSTPLKPEEQYPHHYQALAILYGEAIAKAVLEEVVNSYPEGFVPGGSVLQKIAEGLMAEKVKG